MENDLDLDSSLVTRDSGHIFRFHEEKKNVCNEPCIFPLHLKKLGAAETLTIINTSILTEIQDFKQNKINPSARSKPDPAWWI